jgi:DNA repair exonuclease SbcCD ATPase subunit
MATEEPLELENPSEARKRFEKLRWRQGELVKRLGENKAELARIEAFLENQPKVSERLEALCRDLFGRILDEVERNLSHALKEVLGQDLNVVSTRTVQRGKVTVAFGVERNGNLEDILTGQGGSVCNIISVGLRLIALSQLDEKEHRRFLVLDEQDCWIRPDLVPRLMAIIHAIARRLNFQILVISHHDVSHFRDYADAVYRIFPRAAGDGGVGLEAIEAPGRPPPGR